jgi:osmotically inducible protein OsmC
VLPNQLVELGDGGRARRKPAAHQPASGLTLDLDLAMVLAARHSFSIGCARRLLMRHARPHQDEGAAAVAVVDGGEGRNVAAIYTAEATAVGGREGRVRSTDGALELDLSIPKELGGPGGRATNPEQLFAAGYAACFENALRHVARQRKLSLGQTSVTARVGIGPNGSNGFGLTVELHARLPDLDAGTAQEIVEAADQICPYSNAIRGNVEVAVVVDPEPEVI